MPLIKYFRIHGRKTVGHKGCLNFYLGCQILLSNLNETKTKSEAFVGSSSVHPPCLLDPQALF